VNEGCCTQRTTEVPSSPYTPDTFYILRMEGWYLSVTAGKSEINVVIALFRVWRKMIDFCLKNNLVDNLLIPTVICLNVRITSEPCFSIGKLMLSALLKHHEFFI
jgi:hypothetical protein